MTVELKQVPSADLRVIYNQSEHAWHQVHSVQCQLEDLLTDMRSNQSMPSSRALLKVALVTWAARLQSAKNKILANHKLLENSGEHGGQNPDGSAPNTNTFP